MKKLAILLSLMILFGAGVTSSQDCKSDDEYLQIAVRRVAKEHLVLGWDDKALSRSGDMAAVAIVKTIPDSEMTSPDTIRGVLSVLRMAFACPLRCVTEPGNRHPNVTLLLLEHLQNSNGGRMWADIDETRKYILQQANAVQ